MAAQRQRGEIDSPSEILDVAERLVQSRGFNAFPYADIATKLGITLHYHVPSKRICVCGMLAADFPTLPQAMRDGVMRFFDDNEAWLAQALEQGRQEGTLRFSGPSREAARMLIGALE